MRVKLYEATHSFTTKFTVTEFDSVLIDFRDRFEATR